jgi:Fe-S cluster assembly ATP-binding protein
VLWVSRARHTHYTNSFAATAIIGEAVSEQRLSGYLETRHDRKYMSMLSIENLVASIDEKTILKSLSLEVKPGEIHAIMGPNGSGKSTLGNVLAGREQYEVESGQVVFKGKNLLDLEPEERAAEGLFLAFQYPVEIPGVSNLEFLKAAIDAQAKYRQEETQSSVDFMKQAREACKAVNLDISFLKRGVNEGFSGGEKKRNEIMQMMLLQPKLCLLDETDSGLDIDALQVVANGVNSLRSEDRAFIVVTHYQRLLDYIVPDYVHVLSDGKIVKSGDKSLALELEKKGYSWLGQEVAP